MDSTHSHLYDAAKVPVVDGDYEKGQPELARDDTPVKRDHSNVPGLKGRALRTMDFLVRHGVEERGIEPTPEDQRVALGWRNYIPQMTFWAAMNTNILTFSQGMLGPQLGLDFRASALIIVLFTLVCAVPPAWLTTCGPGTGMRQMVQARYGMGYFPTMVIGLANCFTLLGFMSLTTILGGQCLSLASGGDMSWDVGIAVVCVIGLCLSFIGLRALHILSLTSFPIVGVLYFVLLGVVGDKLPLAVNETAKVASAVTVSNVLGYCASQIGYTASFSGVSSDFTTLLPPHTPKWVLFGFVYTGMVIPIICIQLFGAACQLAAYSIPSWKAGGEIGAANLLFAMTGQSGPAKFIMVLFCLSVVANVASTIYSCGLSGQVVFPFLLVIPRYFLAVVVIAIVLPVAMLGSDRFFEILLNFLSVLGYWTAIYLAPALIEPLVFCAPPNRTTYPVAIWNQIGKLPIGLGFIASACAGIPLAAAGMSQTWWNGWISRRIPGGSGDIGFAIAFAGSAIVYLPARYLERKYTGR